MKNRFSIILIVIVFGSLLIFAGSKGYLMGASNIVHEATRPISIFFSGVSGQTSGFVSGIFQLGKVQKNNAELKDKVNKLQAQVAQLSEDKKENDRLKALLGFTVQNDYSYEASSVLAYDPSNLRGNLTIDKGTDSGLNVGMAVISDGFLVGRISSVSAKTARVQLITDPLSSIPVVLQTANTSGIATGQIGYGLSMSKIPQGEAIKEGDVVITSGLGGEIPRGLILGRVEKVIKQENSLFADADILPSADLSNLARIIVIKSK
jgi:rod shape-determining protein MreC